MSEKIRKAVANVIVLAVMAATAAQPVSAAEDNQQDPEIEAEAVQEESGEASDGGYLKGDVNLDGKVTQIDATIILRESLSIAASNESILDDLISEEGKTKYPENYIEISRYNGDVDNSDNGLKFVQTDATFILRELLKSSISDSTWNRNIEYIEEENNMADKNALIHIKDENGNVNNIFPETKLENVDGLQAELNNKVDKVSGKGLSTNDYTTSEKNKLAGIEAQANKTTISTSIPSTPTNDTVPSMKLVDDTYAPNSSLVSGLATKADNSTVSALADRVTDAETDILTQTARIDAIAALPSGSTSGDAELMDIRIEADGTTATDAGTAVRNQITSVINDVNALDDGNVKFRWELGGLSTSTGDEVVKTDQIRSSKHYIRSNNPIKISCGNKYFFICKYAADGTFLGYDGAWNSEHTLNYDCAYVRVCIASNTAGDGNSLNFKYTKRTFSALEKNTIIYDAVNAADYSYLLRNVLFPCMFNASTEWLDIPQVGGTQWVFVSVKGTGSAYLQIAYALNKALMFTRVAASGVSNDWVEYDCTYKDDTVKYYQPSAASVDNKLSHIFVACTFNAVSSTWADLPQGETSVVFINVKGNGSNAFLQFAYPLTGDYFYTRVTAPNVENSWRKYDCSEREPSDALPVYTLEKKCGCLGDSITYGLKGTSWVTKLDDYCGFTDVINYGVSGSTIKSNGVDGFLDRYQSMAADLDYIVVFGGVNDFMWTTQTKAEFKTNYESLINGLLTRYPEAKMLAVTPMKFEYTGDDVPGIISRRYDTPHQDGVVLKDYVDAEIEVLNKYSVPYIDFFNEVGISPENAAQSTAYFASATDHLHPNTDGNLKIIAPKIAEALKRL